VFEKVASQNAEGALTETLPSIDDTLVAMKRTDPVKSARHRRAV